MVAPSNASPCPASHPAPATARCPDIGRQHPGWPRAPPAPDQRLILNPRHRSTLPSYRDIYRFGRRPSRLTLGVAAATVTAFAGVAIGLSAAGPAGVGATESLAAIHTGMAGHPTATGHAATGIAHGTAPAKRAAPAKRVAVAANQAHHAPARAVLASQQHPRARAVVRHPAKPAVAPVRHAPAPVPAKPAAPYLIYDSVIPSAIPGNGLMATYATGPYAASAAQVAGRSVMWIDVYGTDYNASALDVEPSDATPQMAASWAYHRLSEFPNAIAHIYTNISEWPAVQAACATLPARMQSHIHWWIADPTGVPHLVPGSQATQWYWGQNYDISTAAPNF
jgi:hypothetical protein